MAQVKSPSKQLIDSRVIKFDETIVLELENGDWVEVSDHVDNDDSDAYYHVEKLPKSSCCFRCLGIRDCGVPSHLHVGGCFKDIRRYAPSDKRSRG